MLPATVITARKVMPMGIKTYGEIELRMDTCEGQKMDNMFLDMQRGSVSY
jgi:hypothetical protein